MNEAEKLRGQITKITYRYIPSLFKANTLLGMVDEYAQWEYERGFKDGKEVQKGWEELKDSGFDKPFNHQNQ